MICQGKRVREASKQPVHHREAMVAGPEPRSPGSAPQMSTASNENLCLRQLQSAGACPGGGAGKGGRQEREACGPGRRRCLGEPPTDSLVALSPGKRSSSLLSPPLPPPPVSGSQGGVAGAARPAFQACAQASSTSSRPTSENEDPTLWPSIQDLTEGSSWLTARTQACWTLLGPRHSHVMSLSTFMRPPGPSSHVSRTTPFPLLRPTGPSHHTGPAFHLASATAPPHACHTGPLSAPATRHSSPRLCPSPAEGRAVHSSFPSRRSQLGGHLLRNANCPHSPQLSAT